MAGSGGGTVAVAPRAWKVLGVTALGVFVVFLDTTIVNIAFRAIEEEFAGTSRATLSWVFTAYSIVFAALLVTAGRVADLVGRRRVFLVGLVAFAATSAACGAAPSAAALVGARTLQAGAAALLVPTSLALLLPEFPLARRATAVAVWGAVGALAAATGPTVGALLVQGVGWRWVFLVNLPVCAVAFVLGRRLLVEARDAGADRRLDPVGVVLVSAAMGLLALAIVQGPEWGWTDGRVLAASAGAAVLLPAFLRHSARHPSPVVDPSLFRVRSYAVANVATLVFACGFFASILNNVLFLGGVWDYSVVRTGLAVSPGPILAAAVAGLAGRLADRYGHRVVIVPGALVYAAAQAWFATRVTPEPAYLADFLPGFLLLGLGIGFTFSTLGAAAASSLPPNRFAVGSAVNATARQFGAVLGVATLVAVLGTPGPDEAMAAFDRAWTTIGLTALAAGAVSLLLGRPGRAPAGAPSSPTTAATAAVPAVPTRLATVER